MNDQIDIERYQRISDDLVAFLAGASGTISFIVPQLLCVLATSMDFELATAWRWDEASEMLFCEHLWRKREGDCDSMFVASSGMCVSAGEGLAGWVVGSDEAIWHPDLSHASHLRRYDAIVADGLRTAFLFPLRSRGRLVGVIELFTHFHRQPDAPLNAAVAEIGAKLGDFLERLEMEAQRADLLRQLERSHRHQEFLLRANRALAGARNFQDSVQRLATVALSTLGDICLIDVLHSTGTLERLAAVHVDPGRQAETNELAQYSPDAQGSHPAARAIRTRRSQWSTKVADTFLRRTTRCDAHLELTRSLNVESFVSVPLLVADEAIGALTVLTAGSNRHFGEEELALAEMLASQVSSVIARERTLEEESRISHLLQRSLLPHRLGQLPGVHIAARYVAAGKGAEVGGDFYDVVGLEGSRLALVIGDIEGHDMTAATVMGELRSALRAYLMITQNPGEILSLVNRYVLGQSHDRLATTFLAILDTATRTIEMASAGHPVPLLGCEDTPSAPLGVSPGQLLGVGKADYFTERRSLPAWGSLALFTDGLIDEARIGADGRIRMLATLMDLHRVGDPESLADAILSTLAAPRVGIDDLAILLVQWSL